MSRSLVDEGTLLVDLLSEAVALSHSADDGRAPLILPVKPNTEIRKTPRRMVDVGFTLLSGTTSVK